MRRMLSVLLCAVMLICVCASCASSETSVYVVPEETDSAADMTEETGTVTLEELMETVPATEQATEQAAETTTEEATEALTTEAVTTAAPTAAPPQTKKNFDRLPTQSEADLLVELFFVAKDEPHGRDQQLSFHGRLNSAPRLNKQWKAYLLFKRTHHLRDRRLGVTELITGGRALPPFS